MRVLVRRGGEGAFYAYTYPEPTGYADYLSEADGALDSQSDKLYLLPYEYGRSAPGPDGKRLHLGEPRQPTPRAFPGGTC